MKRILITGAGGFVGTYLIKELTKSKAGDIYGAVYKATSDISSLLDPAHIIEGDLTDASFTAKLIKEVQPDCVYHLAALSVVGSSFSNATQIMNSNTTLSYNLFEALRLHSPHARTLAICSANVYGAVEDPTRPISETTPFRPLNPYAVSKVAQEMLALQYHLAYGMDIVLLRPFNHTGVGQTTDFVIPKLASQFASIERGELPPVLEVGNLDSVRDFTDVADMVRAYTLAATACLPGEAYNIGSGVGVSVAQIIEIFRSLVAIPVELKVKDDLIRSADVPMLVADTTKFKEATAYIPTIPLSQTILRILESYRQKKG